MGGATKNWKGKDRHWKSEADGTEVRDMGGATGDKYGRGRSIDQVGLEGGTDVYEIGGFKKLNGIRSALVW